MEVEKFFSHLFVDFNTPHMKEDLVEHDLAEAGFNCIFQRLHGKPFCSHKNHLGQEVGADHVFISDSSKAKPITIFLHPQEIPFDSWYSQFKISDHRPLVLKLKYHKE